MKIKLMDLTLRQLDWAVAKCLDPNTSPPTGDVGPWMRWWGGRPWVVSRGHDTEFTPSTNPAQGHPIIERERITTIRFGETHTTQWEAFPYDENYHYLDVTAGEDGIQGPTALIAAMRCYVAWHFRTEGKSALDTEVGVPDELTA